MSVYGQSPITVEMLRDQKMQNGITNAALEAMHGPPVTPERIADAAFRETEDVPAFGPADRLAVMLSRINRFWGNMDDNLQAAVIKACRKRAGL